MATNHKALYRRDALRFSNFPKNTVIMTAGHSKEIYTSSTNDAVGIDTQDYIQWRIQRENPAMVPPSSLVIDIGPPPTKI